MLAALLLTSSAPIDLTYVRHGETVANATGVYNSRTLNVFSEKGEAGVAALTDRLLKQPRYDRIWVSPSPRALKTIAPYLRRTGQKATVWPLAYECCTGRRPAGARATKFTYGAKIVIPGEIRDLFLIESGRDRYPVASNYNSGLAQAAASVSDFWNRVPSGRILIVGHSGHGGQFLRVVAGVTLKVENTKEYRFSVRRPAQTR